MILLDAIVEKIRQVSGQQLEINHTQAIGGGCINSAMKIVGGGRDYFVKVNRASLLPMFEAEAEALNLMQQAAIRVPRPVCWGATEQDSYLVLEYLALSGTINQDSLGQQLAALHQITDAHYGWHRDNTLGSTSQINTRDDNWIRFWQQHRLGYQLQLAQANGYSGELQTLGQKLLEQVPGFFSGYSPSPSMLHGDLWGGNAAALTDGTPVIYDPALYYGDREADLAMTELFGGFGARFYAAYNEVWPLDAGYKHRKTLYNLYHILNHLNLFGGGYRQQAMAMMRQLLAR